MALGNLTVRLGLDAADYLSGLSKAEAEAAKFAKQQERTSLAIDKQIKALQDQAATLGLSERQLKIVELAQRGATKAQLESANAALKQKEAFQAADKAISKAAASAKATTDAAAAIDKQVKALHDQVAVQGRSERQTKLYELTQQGATKAQLASADAALRQKAAYEGTTKFMRDLGRAALVLGAALGTAAVAGVILFEKFVGKAASFQDLAEKTGASAEALASFQVAASVTNTSMDTLANLSVKLTKGLAGTDEETKQAANAIKELGLNVEDFKKLDPAAQFEVIAKRLNDFADGSGKVKFAVAAMGRSGAEALPFLKELGSQGQRNVILTAAQIKAADDYKDAQVRLRAEIELFATKLAVLAIGPVQDFQKALLETAKQILGISGATSDLANNKGIENFAQEGARALAVLVNGLDLVARGFRLTGTAIAAAAAEVKGVTEGRPSGILLGPVQGFKSIVRRMFPEAKQIIEPPLFSSNLEAAIQKRLADIDTEPGGSTARPKPPLRGRFGGGGGASDAASKAAAEAKKLLDKQLSDLDNFIKSEDRILQTRESALSRHYQNDQLSIASYFDARRASLELNTQATVAAYDKQIEALEDFAKRSKSATARLEAEAKIGDVQEKRAEAQSKAAEARARADDEQTRAARAYADQVDELRAKVLELSNAEGAATQATLIRFDIQNRALKQRATAEGDTGALKNIAILRQSEDSRTRINDLLKDAQVIEERLGTTEARLHLERDLGLRGELASLGELGKARAAALPEYQRIADKLEELRAIAVSLGDQQSIAAIDRFNLKVQELAATTDVLADKFRNVFEDSFADAFASFIDGTTSAKDAFKAFADDVVRQINRMAAQEIAGSLFGKGGGGGNAGLLAGFVDFFANLFKAKGGPVAANEPYIVGERGPEIFVSRTVAAEATRNSLVSQKGKPAEYIDRVRAATVATNLPHLIGAKGPEIFVPKVDGIVIPNDKVNKLSRVLQGRAKGGPVVSATPYIVGERGPEIFTPRNTATLGPQEKFVTRLVSSVQPKASQVASNMPRVARGPELFVSKAAGIPNDKVAKLARSFGSDRPKVPSYSPPGGTPRLAGQMLAVGRSSQPTNFDLSSERSSLAIHLRDFERKAVAPAAVVARRREISAPLVAARTIMRDEKIITRYANAPYSRPAAAHVPYIGGREIFIPKPAAVQRDEAVSKFSTAVQKQSQRGIDKALGLYERGKSGGAALLEKAQKTLKFQWGSGGAEQSPAQGRSTSASVASRSSAASAAITSRWNGDSATKTSRIIHERAPQVYIQQSATEIRNRAATGLGLPPVIGAHQPTRDLARPALKLAARMGIVPTLTEPSKRAVAELVLDAPHQRRADGGPVEASTPYVVGELGPELFMPKSAERVINHEKAIDDLVSNKIQHRATSAPKVTYLGEQGHEIFISKLASTNIKNEKFISDLVSNNVQHGASVKNQKIQNDLVSNTRTEKIINQLVLNKQRGPFAVHQAYLIGKPELVVRKSAEKIIKNENLVSELVTNNVKRNEKIINDLVANSVRRRESAEPAHQTYVVGKHGREIPKSARKVIADDKAATRVRSPLLERRQHDLVSNTNVLSEKLASTNIKNEKFIDLVSNTVQRRAIGSPITTRTPYIVDKFGAEVFMPKAAANQVQELRNVRGSHYGLFPALELGLTSAHTPLRALNFKETDHVSIASSRINKNEMMHNDLVSNTRNEKTINQLVSNIQRRTELELYGQKYHRADNSGRKFARHLAKTLIRDGVRPRDDGLFAAHQTYLLDASFNIQAASGNKARSERFVTDPSQWGLPNILGSRLPLVTKIIQHKAQGSPVQAPKTYIVGERGPELFATKSAEKIIKNENSVSELVTNNAKRNENVINDLVSKTAHYRQSAEISAKIIKNENRVSELVTNNARRNEKVINDLVSNTVHQGKSSIISATTVRQRGGDEAPTKIAGSVAAQQSSIPFNLPRSGLAISSPNVAAKIIKNESRISELVSNDVQRKEEIINRLATTTRRENGRSNQLLIVGANGPELFIPKADGSIIKNEQRINELVSNIEHRNIDRRSQKTIDEIISSTVQRRAKGGPLTAYQTRLVGERGFERFIGSETNITNNNNGLSVPADFFSNASYRRAVGGPVISNHPYIVGERGPEWFVPKSAGTIIPNGKAGGMVVNVQFVLPPGGYTRATQNQIAADTGRVLSIANRRLG